MAQALTYYPRWLRSALLSGGMPSASDYTSQTVHANGTIRKATGALDPSQVTQKSIPSDLLDQGTAKFLTTGETYKTHDSLEGASLPSYYDPTLVEVTAT